MRTMFRVIDFETTGTPSEEEKHDICEIGWSDVLIVDGEVRDPLLPQSMLINPNRPMPIEALAVHHIRDADLVGAEALFVGLRALQAGMGQTSVYVAHNADFERNFFSGGEVPWICTLKAAYRIWPDAPKHSNQVLRYFLGLDLPAEHAMPPHRAGPDAYVTAWILATMLREGANPDELIHWSSGPALLPKIGFGKHRGSKWEDVPTDYLEWIIKQTDMDRDARANAKYHLRKRGQDV